MEVLLREFRQGQEGEYTDRTLTTDVITIGSAPDRTIQLPAIADELATIRQTRGGFALEVRGRGPVKIRDALVKRRAKLGIDDTIEISGNRITRAEPPAGFDLALLIVPLATVAGADPESAFRTRLEQTGLSRRQLAWMLFLATSLITFLVPLQVARVRGPPVKTAAGSDRSLQQTSAKEPLQWLPDDSFWSAGPLSPAHALRFNGQCRDCHRDFFVHVRDADCQACHTTFSDDHVSPAHRTRQLGNARPCRSCHEEHKSNSGSIVVRNNALCVTCHAHAQELFGHVKLATVSGFSGPDAHPSFSATVLAAAEGLDPQKKPPPGVVPTLWPLSRVTVASGEEHTNLKEYSHVVHLDPTRVSRDGKPLACSACHVLGLDGRHFVPITMAANCMTDCHELTFDPEEPKRRLPHGQPRDAVLLIEDYYAHKYADPHASVPPRLRRRLPDKPEPEERCHGRLGPALGKCLAEEETKDQFRTTGCAQCHQVRDGGESVPLESRFEIHPVRFTQDYFPRATFSHRQHAIQEGKTGDAACLSCHAADQSENITRLMLPDRDRCLRCHADLPIGNRVQVQCTSCHVYHLQR